MKILFNKFLIAGMVLLSLVVIVSCEEDDKETEPQFIAPELSLVSPLEGLIGDEVVIAGDNLKDVVSVKFGSIEAEGFSISGNEISVTVPGGLEAGETTITVFYEGASANNLGPSSNIEFIVLYPPLITSTFPTEAKPGFEVQISGSYLADVTSIKFGDFPVSGFEATETKIVTAVPADATAGDVQLEITTSGGTTSIDFTVSPSTPEVYSFNPIDGGKTGEQITVTGLFFIDVQSVLVGDVEVDDYTVNSDTELSFTIPVGASTNPVTVNNAFGGTTSSFSVPIIEIPFIVFAEGLHPQLENWGWGGSDDFLNTEVAMGGTYSYKRTHNDGWAATYLHHNGLDLSIYTTVSISVYGEPGTTGKELNFSINWGASVPITVTEGVWTDYTILLSDLGSPASLNDFVIQENGDTAPAAPFSIYFDNISFNE